MGNCTITGCIAALYQWTGKGSDVFADANAVQRPTVNEPRTFGNAFPVVRDHVPSFFSTISDSVDNFDLLDAGVTPTILSSALPTSATHDQILPREGHFPQHR